MSITYPPRLQYILDQPDLQLFTVMYISSPPDQVEEAAEQYTLPDNFEKYSLDSSFLTNFWSSIIGLLIIILSIALVSLGMYPTRNCKTLNSKCAKLREALKLNYLIAVFSGFFGDIAFYTSFEMRTLHLGTTLEIVSFVICVVMNIAVITLSIKMLIVARKVVNAKNTKRLKLLKEQLKDYQIIFESYKHDSICKQAYSLIFCLRLYFFNSVIVYLFEYPLVQAIIITAQGILFLFYLIVKRPFREKTDLVGSMAQEFLLLTVHVSVLALAVLDTKESDAANIRIVFGDIIIACKVAFFVVGCIYLLIQVFVIIRDLYGFIRKKLTKSTTQRFSRRRVQDTPPLNASSDIPIINESRHHMVIRSSTSPKTRAIQRPEANFEPGDRPRLSKAERERIKKRCEAIDRMKLEGRINSINNRRGPNILNKRALKTPAQTRSRPSQALR